MTPMVMTKAIKILMIEGDQDNVYTLKEALTVAQIVNVEVSEVDDGEQALAYLRQEHPFLDVSCPDLIFLDLQLPGMSGIEVLEAIDHERHLKTIPMAILNNKTNPRLASKIQRSALPRYIFKKPTNCNEWIYTLRCIEDVWVTIKNTPGQRAL